MTEIMPTVMPIVLRAGSPTAASPVGGADWPDTFAARREVLALMQALNAMLLGARSATCALERWCAGTGLVPERMVRARVARAARKEPTADQRGRLKAGSDEIVNYRRVELVCGDRVLSEADNWYVPARLTPDMNRLLETTDVPFGRIVRAFEPFRETFETTIHWTPLPDGPDNGTPPPENPGAPLAIPPVLFGHRALLVASDKRPLAEVHEVYRRDVLALGARE